MQTAQRDIGLGRSSFPEDRRDLTMLICGKEPVERKMLKLVGMINGAPGKGRRWN